MWYVERCLNSGMVTSPLDCKMESKMETEPISPTMYAVITVISTGST